MKNAIELFESRVKQSASKTALRYKQDGVWRSETWNDWATAAREVAGGLCALGVAVGDRVSILANTRREWLHCDLGVVHAGAATVPIYQSSVGHECEYILKDSGAKVLFVEDPSQLEKVIAARARLPGLERIVYFDSGQKRKDGSEWTIAEVVPEADRKFVLSLEDLRKNGREYLASHPEELDRRKKTVEPIHTFTIVYTSGTTGPPKGVVLMHSNIVWECEAMREVMPVDENDEQLLFLPMAHIFAKILEWTSISRGSSIAFAESIAQLKANLSEVHPTYLCAVPRVLEKMYFGILGNRNSSSPLKQKIFDWAFAVGKSVSRHRQKGEAIGFALGVERALAHRLVFHKIHDLLGGRIRFIISGGAPLGREIAEFFHSAGVQILEGWGLTETTAGTCVNRVDRYAFGTVGAPVPGLEVKIADDGEILVRGGSVMKEYFNKPDATSEAIEKDGWFHTGDIGEFENGMLRITDRKKDLIVNAGGKKIPPQNLENALKTTPYISQIMVHGDKRPYLTALVTLNEDNIGVWARGQGVMFSSLSDLATNDKVRGLIQQAIDEVNAREPSYSSIKKFAILPQDFSLETGELTPTLKVKRKFTSDKYRSILDGFYNA